MNNELNELFFLPKASRDKLILHLYDVSACLRDYSSFEKNDEKEKERKIVGKKNKELLKYLLGLKQGVAAHVRDKGNHL